MYEFASRINSLNEIRGWSLVNRGLNMADVKNNQLLYTLVSEISGEEAAEVVALLDDKNEITDEAIGDRTGYKLNTVRRILYKLYESHLASYRRVRDKNTGWFVYFWRLNPEKISDIIRDKRRFVLKKLEERISYEKDHVFYVCNSDGSCLRYTFEQAIELSFQCPKCHKPLQHFDNTEIVQVLNDQIKNVKDQLND